MEARVQLSVCSSRCESSSLVVFLLDEQRYGLRLSAVERVVRIVEITPLPKQPEAVSGVINVQGQIIPVINLRRRLRLPDKEWELSDQFIIARTSRRMVALAVDRVAGVVERPAAKIVAMGRIVPGIEHFEGALKLEDGLVLIIDDLDTLLSLEEEAALGQVIPA